MRSFKHIFGRTALTALGILAVACVAILAVGCGGGGQSASTATSYLVQDMGVTGDYDFATALDITDSGRAVIAAQWSTDQYDTWIREADGSMRVLPDTLSVGWVVGVSSTGRAAFSTFRDAYTLDIDGHSRVALTGSYAQAAAINDEGVTVGSTDSAAVKWDSNGSRTILPSPDGSTWSSALDVNNNGCVVGWCHDLKSVPYMWDADGRTGRELEFDRKYESASALLVNDRAQIVISYSSDDASSRAVLIQLGGSVIELQGMGQTSIQPHDINDAGQVVGSIGDGSSNYRAVTWGADGSVRELPLPAGQIRSNASGINNSGLIVGGSLDASGHWHALLWTPVR